MLNADLEINQWHVDSQSNSAIYYVIDKHTNGAYTCDCDDFARRSPEPCKHIFAVQLHLGELNAN